MKKTTFLLTMLIITAMAIAQNHTTFLGLPLNMNLEAFSKALEGKGYALQSSDQATKAVFTGNFGGINDMEVTVLATPKSHTVYFVGLSKKSSDTGFKQQYTNMYEAYYNDLPKETTGARNFNLGSVSYDFEIHGYNLVPGKGKEKYGRVNFVYYNYGEYQQIIVEFIDIANKDLSEKEK